MLTVRVSGPRTQQLQLVSMDRPQEWLWIPQATANHVCCSNSCNRLLAGDSFPHRLDIDMLFLWTSNFSIKYIKVQTIPEISIFIDSWLETFLPKNPTSINILGVFGTWVTSHSQRYPNTKNTNMFLDSWTETSSPKRPKNSVLFVFLVGATPIWKSSQTLVFLIFLICMLQSAMQGLNRNISFHEL